MQSLGFGKDPLVSGWQENGAAVVPDVTVEDGIVLVVVERLVCGAVSVVLSGIVGFVVDSVGDTIVVLAVVVVLVCGAVPVVFPDVGFVVDSVGDTIGVLGVIFSVVSVVDWSVVVVFDSVAVVLGVVDIVDEDINVVSTRKRLHMYNDYINNC